jgi:nucleotide-binding universal stress UspA family protein
MIQLIPEIKKILYATDLSKNARYAFAYAARLANCCDGKITILHVLEELPEDATSRLIDMMGRERWEELQKDKRHEVIDNIKARLEKFCTDVSGGFPDCRFVTEEIKIAEGNPEEQIISESERGGYDLIVMGTHGHGTFAEAMMGSTAKRVVRRSLKPVLVVRLPE